MSYETKHIVTSIFLIFSLNVSTVNAQKNYEIIAKVMPPDPDMSGIAVNSQNRVFVGFPRHADNHSNFSLAELKNGKLIPYPNKDYVFPSNRQYQDWLVSPHGMYMDKNDILWVLDDGKRAGIKTIPFGAAKIVGIDTHNNKVLKTVDIPKNILADDAHYNDLRIDLSHGKEGTIYIANSGFGEHYSLLVIDIASGRGREVLRNHYSTSPKMNFMGYLEGKPLVYNFKHQTFPNGGADGIALSPDDSKLYWTAITGRELYSLPTKLLSDSNTSNQDLELAVKDEGQRPACDGLAEDEKGNIYFGSFEQQSIVKRNLDGQYTLLAHDKDNFVWPDGLAYQNGYLYVTLGQWNRLSGFNGGKDLRKPPYLIIKIKADTIQ